MTLTQIEYALACARFGSMSIAASELFVSISNISKVIGQLETEMGFPIFERNRSGLTMTISGEKFLKYAGSIVNDLAKIREIQPGSSGCNYSIHATSCSFAFNAYLRLLCKHEKSPGLNFSFLSANSWLSVLNSVEQKECNVGFITLRSDVVTLNMNMIRRGPCVVEEIGKLPVYIKLRRGHPLLENGKEHFDFSKLALYPHIESSKIKRYTEEFLKNVFPTGGIDTQKVVVIDNRDWKLQAIASTDCFSAGILDDPNPVCKAGPQLEYVPIPNLMLSALCIVHKETPLNTLGKEYISYLKEQIARAGNPE